MMKREVVYQFKATRNYQGLRDWDVVTALRGEIDHALIIAPEQCLFHSDNNPKAFYLYIQTFCQGAANKNFNRPDPALAKTTKNCQHCEPPLSYTTTVIDLPCPLMLALTSTSRTIYIVLQAHNFQLHTRNSSRQQSSAHHPSTQIRRKLTS
jgi:hypothetical protein